MKPLRSQLILDGLIKGMYFVATMGATKYVGKREFIQHTSKYLKLAETSEEPLVITHQNMPCLQLVRIPSKSIRDLKGLVRKVKIVGDINDPILPGYDEW